MSLKTRMHSLLNAKVKGMGYKALGDFREPSQEGLTED